MLASSIILLALAGIGLGDETNNLCTTASLGSTVRVPKGLKNSKFPKIAGTAQLYLGAGISVKLTEARPEASYCRYRFFNSGNIQKQVWVTDGGSTWSSIWVYGDSRTGPDGCDFQTDCDPNNDGLYVGTVM